ncbi:hypothetical protein WMY93_011711 [Mugilogobius chulae]|uniref:Uncharacterized protein n=1 Tax=Mugilogobius chulae TaxID=88201 RepID=A0AAW0P3F4_9GOBI
MESKSQKMWQCLSISERDDADPKKASDEFTTLVQSCSKDWSSSSIDFKNVGLEEWKETLKMIQMTDHKCQITISPDQITIYGPQQYQTAISKSLQQRPKISTNLTDEERVDHQEKMITSSYTDYRKSPTRSKIRFTSSIKDQFVTDGLPVEENYWKTIKSQHKGDLDKIMEKFNVRFEEVIYSQGQKVIKVRYNRPEGNIQMESHAIRALLRLYQRVATSQFIKNNGVVYAAEGGQYNSYDKHKEAAEKMNGEEETKGGAVKKRKDPEAKKDEKEEEKWFSVLGCLHQQETT